MTPADLAAYIGAAAWLPQIASWLYKSFAKPVLTTIPDARAEIGYTTLGPILNIRLAFAAEREDIIINDLRLDLTHEDGEKRTLRWVGIQEELGETRDALGVKQGALIKQQERPIALKIGTVALIERYVRFQEPRYHEADVARMKALVEHFDFLKAQGGDFVPAVLRSRELHTVIETRSNHFWWKPGRYQVTFQPISSNGAVRIKNQNYSFVLGRPGAERLRKNIPTLRTELEQTVNSNLPDFKPTELVWEWAYEDLTRLD